MLGYRLSIMGVLGASLSMLTLGCATSGSEVRHGIAAGQWEARLPATKSPIAGLAYGSGGSSQRTDDLGVDAALASLDRNVQLSAAEPAPAARRVKAAPSKAAHRTVAALAASPERKPLAEPAVPALQSRLRVDTPVTLAHSASTERASDSRYAEREAASQEQQRFAGGDAIVITSGAVVLALLIVLLILLLR